MDKKSSKTTFIETILGQMARCILWRHKPYIIAITGSVGKTTTKDMIVAILEKHKRIFYTKKNNNNEIGVPLTIMGWDEELDSSTLFITLFFRWLKMMICKKYPEIVIVEMGVDRPGDMDYLMSIVSPDISVLTAISYAHSEFFDNLTAIKNEKQKIITRMKKNGVGIINHDDMNVRDAQKKTHTKIMTYGMENNVDFLASDVEICFHNCHTTGLSFKLNYDGKVIPVRLNHVIARHFIYAALASLAVADVVGINVVDAIGYIVDFYPAPGRMRLLDGKKNTMIIDDTYNASPRAMEAAIATLIDAPGKRKIAILGDMRELGEISQKEHKNIINVLLKKNVDAIFLIGNEMTKAYNAVEDKKNIVKKCFTESQDAIKDVSHFIREGDTILIKGSRGIFMEKIVNVLVVDTTQTLCTH